MLGLFLLQEVYDAIKFDQSSMFMSLVIKFRTKTHFTIGENYRKKSQSNQNL